MGPNKQEENENFRTRRNVCIGVVVVGLLLFIFCPGQAFISAHERSWSTWPLAIAGMAGLAMAMGGLWVLWFKTNV